LALISALSQVASNAHNRPTDQQERETNRGDQDIQKNEQYSESDALKEAAKAAAARAIDAEA
jgi:hypothetical protein